MFTKQIPLVSVLIPSYNHGLYIIEALNSIVSDNYVSKEIIIVDDGSSDDSVIKIQNWIEGHKRDGKITFITRENRGLTSTLNELILLASGKYLLPLASDDLLLNNTIQERVSILERNSDKLVLLCDANVINHEGIELHKSVMTGFHGKDKSVYSSAKLILDEIVFNFTISGSVAMMNKKIYDYIGFYPTDLKADDLFFYIKVVSANKLLFYDKVVSSYRIHNSNTCGNNPELMYSVLKTYIRTIRYIPGVRRKLRLLKRISWVSYAIVFNKQ
jgi:alpha-1,3-rhamnosyltransferase